MQYTRIQYAADRRIARITLNRPEKRNALDDVMVQELTAAVAVAGRDPSVKALRLDANGPAFCAGADLEYLQRLSTFDHEENLADSRRLSQLFRALYELRKPTVAVVDGPPRRNLLAHGRGRRTGGERPQLLGDAAPVAAGPQVAEQGEQAQVDALDDDHGRRQVGGLHDVGMGAGQVEELPHRP